MSSFSLGQLSPWKCSYCNLTRYCKKCNGKKIFPKYILVKHGCFHSQYRRHGIIPTKKLGRNEQWNFLVFPNLTAIFSFWRNKLPLRITSSSYWKYQMRQVKLCGCFILKSKVASLLQLAASCACEEAKPLSKDLSNLNNDALFIILTGRQPSKGLLPIKTDTQIISFQCSGSSDVGPIVTACLFLS